MHLCRLFSNFVTEYTRGEKTNYGWRTNDASSSGRSIELALVRRHLIEWDNFIDWDWNQFYDKADTTRHVIGYTFSQGIDCCDDWRKHPAWDLLHCHPVSLSLSGRRQVAFSGLLGRHGSARFSTAESTVPKLQGEWTVPIWRFEQPTAFNLQNSQGAFCSQRRRVLNPLCLNIACKWVI
jgi:hypothetical protein